MMASVLHIESNHPDFDKIDELLDLEPVEEFNGHRGVEQWNWHGDTIAINFTEVSCSLYKLHNCYWFTVHSENGFEGLYKISTNDEKEASNEADIMFQNETEIF